MEINGRCSCGAVAFRFSMEAPRAFQCHCSICRKATGSAFTTTLMAPVEGFEWLRGEGGVSFHSKPNGYTLGFCSSCGSPVPNRFRDYPLYSVPVGSLDDPPEIPIVAQLYLGSRAKWAKEGLVGRRYEEMPSLHEMLALLHPEESL
jgi:hypothetical protein